VVDGGDGSGGSDARAGVLIWPMYANAIVSL
jgi:hypothetical protein